MLDIMKFYGENQQLVWQAFDAIWKTGGVLALVWSAFQHFQIKKAAKTNEPKTGG